MRYKYFIKKDPNEEQVGIVDASNDEDAIKISAQVKKMSIKTFKKLFSVLKLDI